MLAQTLRQVGRLALVAAAALAAVASASSSSNTPPLAVGNYNTTPPPPQNMDAASALGLWKTSFGPVKIEFDSRVPNGVHGVWVYDRQGQEVVGYFGGALRGNVLDFTWNEPAAGGGALTGAGYLVFDPAGGRFSGRWWTDTRDRVGEWTGWRGEGIAQPQPLPDDPYGGVGYGGGGYVPPQ